MAPYRAILRYYRCDTPYCAILFKAGGVSLPQNGAISPPWYLVLHRHICAIPHFATYRAIIVRYPIKTSTKEFCDTIATSIARYEKVSLLGLLGDAYDRNPHVGFGKKGVFWKRGVFRKVHF